VHHPVTPHQNGAFPVTKPGGRYVDVTVRQGARTVNVEIKTSQQWITRNGVAVRNIVQLTPELNEQIAKDVAIMAANPGHHTIWTFLGAPPSQELLDRLSQAGIIVNIHH
jgi:hypothetical protein